MKRFNKLSRDTRPQEQPEGTYVFGKNGIQNYVLGATINEPGFQLSAANIPYKVNGIIETDKYPVILSTDNTNSAIGYFNPEDDSYIPILNDASLPFKLGFNTNHYITGQAQRNYKGEIVIAFTDKRLFPFYVNCDNPSVGSLSDLMLFPVAVPPVLDVSVKTGGTLLPGAYYTGIRYGKKDGTDIGVILISAPKIIDGTAGQVTDKSLEINLTNIDPNYDQVQLVIISKINGVLTAVQTTEPVYVKDRASILYTGAELTEPITLEEVLTPRKIYTKVQNMGQLNDALYLTGLESPKPPNMQKWANMIRLRWHSKLVTVDPVYEPMKNGTEKSLMHKEVYAWYIAYRLTSGALTNKFHIPGPALLPADRANSTLATAEGVVAKKFQVEDTIASFDAADKSGYMGKWENSTHLYPNTADYDSSGIGGEDLRGQPVRHHRMPSINWCKQNLYSGNPEYGKTVLDMLGISVENVVIPDEYKDQITGWELYFAKRTPANSTIAGQSLLLFGSRNRNEPQYNPVRYYSTGGNFNAEVEFKNPPRNTLLLDQSVFHFHGFDVLFNKPAIAPDFLSIELQHKRVNIPSGAFIENQKVNGDNDGPIVYKFDYIQEGVSPTLPAKKLKAIKNTTLVPNHTAPDRWDNLGIESFFGGRLSNPEALIPDNNVNTLQVQPKSQRTYTDAANSVQEETTFLVNLMSKKEDIYVPFTGQTLARAAVSLTVQNSAVFYGGDTYVCDYSFHTYGRWVFSGSGTLDGDTYFQGTKTVRRFICETAANLYSRYEDPANVYSKYYPKSPLIYEDPGNYLTNFIRTNDPNQFGYKKDFNALDDLVSSDIFNTFAEYVTEHPYRIHRTGKLSRQTKLRNWRTCLPLDYYEAQKNMGYPVHLEGMDDRLLIHFENALMVTQDKTKLESDVISVTLGTADIFQFAPQEAMSSKLGYAGTQHDLACVRTPFGYVFIDSKQGQLFIWKGQLKLLNNRLNDLILKFMRIKEKNVFNGNGYTIGYDPQYKRMLVTVKNRILQSNQSAPAFTPDMIPTLTAGDVVYKDGRLQRFLGVNATPYSCGSTALPVVADLTVSISETTARGTLVATIAGTNVTNFYFVGNSAPFTIEPATGKVYLNGPLDYYVKNQYILAGKGTNSAGEDAFVLTMNITAVNRAPVVKDAEVRIEEQPDNATVIHTVSATDREGGVLTYSIASGNNGAFAINSSTGQITVVDNTKLKFSEFPVHRLVINVSDGSLVGSGVIMVYLSERNLPPQVSNAIVTILDTTPAGEVVHVVTGTDPEGGDVTYALVTESAPGVFNFNPETREIKLINSSALNPQITPQYTMQLSASDGINTVNFTVTINVEYSRGSIKFEPDTASCVTGCPVGYALSPDGLTCRKVNTVPATPPSGNGGTPGTVVKVNNTQWNTGGGIIFLPGFPLSGDGTPDVGLTTPHLWVNGETQFDPLTRNLVDSRMNAAGIWASTNGQPANEWIGFSRKITLPAAKTVYIGMSADNSFRFAVNGVDIVNTDIPPAPTAGIVAGGVNFNYWNIYPVDLLAGDNYIEMYGYNFGADAGMAVEIYDMTRAQLIAATSETDLNILFSTKDIVGQPFDLGQTAGWSCPAGYYLDTNVDGAPVCRQIQTIAPVAASAKHWAKVKVVNKKDNSQIALVDNTLNPVRYFQDMVIPYYPDINGHTDCGGAVNHYLSVEKKGTAVKECTTGTGTTVEYVVPAGSYLSTVSQADADALAQADVDRNKQAYANLKGKCS